MSVSLEVGEGYSVVKINDKLYLVQDFEDACNIPIAELNRLRIEEFPKNFKVNVCSSVDSYTGLSFSLFHHSSVNFIINLDNTITVEFEKSSRWWDNDENGSELKAKMEIQKLLIQKRSKNYGDIIFNEENNFCIDEPWIYLSYSMVLKVNTFEEMLNKVNQIYNEIEGEISIELGEDLSEVDSINNEFDFSTKILIPLLRKMGFTNVKYNHGNREYGKDITFARLTEFGEQEYWGVQVKYGNISGNASNDIIGLVSQAKDAFAMPYHDVYSKDRVKISKLIIAISGKFTNNATEKIIDGISEYPLKNNIIFIDYDKISNLFEKYQPTKIIAI